MPTMTKRVNIQARTAIRNTNPPIYGTINDIIMSTGDILKCLVKKATVDEILPDGSTVRLNYKNYYLDNGAGLDAISGMAKIKPKKNIKPAIKEEPKVEFISESIEKDTSADIINDTSDITEEPAEEKPEVMIAATEPENVTVNEDKVSDTVDDNNESNTSENTTEIKAATKDNKKKSTSSKKK